MIDKKKKIQIDHYNQDDGKWQIKAGKEYYINDMMRLLPHISGNVLEISAGRFTSRITELCDNLTVLDISHAALKSVKNATPNRILADAANMPFKDNCFDYSIGFGVLHHVAQVEKTISESVRVARKGVYFLMERNPLEIYYSSKILLQRRKEEYGMFKLPVWKYRKILNYPGYNYKITITDFASVGFSETLYNFVKKLEQRYLKKAPFIMNFASHINLYINLA